MANEKTPLLQDDDQDDDPGFVATKPSLLSRLSGAVAGTFRVIISTLLAPGRWLVACFYDDQGKFSALLPLQRLATPASARSSRRQRTPRVTMAASSSPAIPPRRSSRTPSNQARAHATGASTDDVPVFDEAAEDTDSSTARRTRRRTMSSVSSDDGDAVPSKRSIRINVLNEDALRRRRQQRQEQPQNVLTVESIKSPTSPLASKAMHKYPRLPGPPRPLIPKRQPSYSSGLNNQLPPPTKTLVIDLDETLIHSMSKGGRMTTGHMVEVKLDQPIDSDGKMLGPQVPILYYVHKRPFCDEFLRKVSKWYNLIVFTASVQQYADPVIDWLELERKYFSARYYRQHCTFKNGAFIKDLSLVEPDLSKVMILDNSPLSYIFHEDNAIPIEGWISDPTDSDLLHLIPFLEGLQYATDVRALLALRLGESTAAS